MNHYPGINAAALAVLLGRTPMARHLATEVRERCLKALDDACLGKTGHDEYWLNATLGEACVIRGELNEAELWYGNAVKIALEDRRFGDMGSTFRQLKLLARFLKLDLSVVSELFCMPRVGLFAGHMIDQSGRSPERFPERLVPRIKEEIKAWLDRSDVRIGFASAACGADLIFLESILERGGAANVVLPFNAADYLKASVEVAGRIWTDRFEDVLRKASVQTLTDHPFKWGESSYDFANRILHGLALIHTRQLSTELNCLVVWDGQPGDGPGGTCNVVNDWHHDERAIDVIPVPNVRPATPLDQLGWPIPPPFAALERRVLARNSEFGTRIVALLFADVVGFSKLSEEQVPAFVETILQMVADLLDGSGYPTETRDIWGDRLFVVFDHVRDAGRFTLELRDRVRETCWEDWGLPEDLSLRIALHAGPVYLCTDPLTRRPNCIGTWISQAARIAPVTPPGEIYASEAFAALATAENIVEFDCQPIGYNHVAGDSGILSLYHVNHRR
jgi:class 3 adenylate cyclase